MFKKLFHEMQKQDVRLNKLEGLQTDSH